MRVLKLCSTVSVLIRTKWRADLLFVKFQDMVKRLLYTKEDELFQGSGGYQMRRRRDSGDGDRSM